MLSKPVSVMRAVARTNTKISSLLSTPIRQHGTQSSSTPQRSILDAHDTFVRRHLGSSTQADVSRMLDVIGVKSLTQLIDNTVPAQIRKKPLNIGPEQGEKETLDAFKKLMSQNQIFDSYIGAGYYNVITPGVILRNILENPGWYTPYTPYQAEIAQGRLEMLLNFQTMCCDLTGLPVASASLLDEATAVAEAMNLCLGMSKNKNTFLVDSDVHPQTIAVVKTRAAGIGVNVIVAPYKSWDLTQTNIFGAVVQYPSSSGLIDGEYATLTEKLHNIDAKIVVAADLLSLSILTPPGQWGADVVCGSAQRFGVPMGYGGPHAAYFTCQEAHKRKMPGRIIGVSRDSRGKPALRMAMQTREQHIRRDKATSNICTAQALLANMAAAYGIYHGPQGLKTIASKIHAGAAVFAYGAEKLLGMKLKHKIFFDTVAFEVPGSADNFVNTCLKHRINIRKYDANNISVSFDETLTPASINRLFTAFAEASGKSNTTFDASSIVSTIDLSLPTNLQRTSEFMTHPVFNMYHCETEMLRYLYSLQSKDLSLQTAMIPLGSCTMKLNATSEMIPVTWPEVANIHPFAPAEQVQGYRQMLTSLERDLCDITGFAAVSLQPNAGSQGEYAGLLAIAGYHQSRGESHRNICLIPTSAHGTNPASAVMVGFKVVVIKCDDKGEIDFADLKAQAEKHSANLGALMVTYPSTHGVFEENIKDVIALIHSHGGQVYMDGANMNAQVGLCSPGEIGADVCHLNLHKTFCIPHGGGGPGMGPIGVAKHLAPFLPSHPWANKDNKDAKNTVGAVSAAPFSSAAILPISYMYIKMMGSTGLQRATSTAILNANYMANRLKGHYNILYTGAKGNVAHEFIVDLRPFKASTGIVEEDVAKRLMDYNFHAPTMSWPVVGTLMIEPTESESLYELDRFCDAMISIRNEIREIEQGKADLKNNVLKNAPHTADVVLADTWERPYPREKAAYPLAYLRQSKFWPSVGRLDNVYGDRNVVCTCPPLSAYSS